ncbi:DUF3052 domain-containing protein [Ideonella sp. BN130291]|uniref:DUF3052 domain-containing protein n=1 Tax=Ideonella sp. BN130291 TaxID=3112940 RepID=UPI002E2569A0|nr:DUF3052 domain-containing protein [Ideonella sp. BN130291]
MPSATPPAGYSGTPLPKKLGIVGGTRLLLLNAPADFTELLQPLPDGVVFMRHAGQDVDIVHLFATQRDALGTDLASLRRTLAPNATVWVSWPKKASRVPTTLTEDTIRELALPMGWVDVKVCAVDAVWSGLKLVVRREHR